MMIFSLLALSLAFPVQEGEDGPLLAAFEKLPAAQQASIVEEIESAIRGLNTPLGNSVEKILSRDDSPKEPFETWKGPFWHDPKEFAPGLPIPRKLLSEDDPKTVAAQNKFLKGKIAPEINGSLRYFPGSNKILRLWKRATPADALKNYLAGYPPHADLAKETLLLLLDDDSEMDLQADYFAHAYSDRDGNVSPGVTLFDVWNSGYEIEMPDIDAIPFARKILKDNSYKSPIPAGARRNALYRKIGEAFQDYRRYLFLREAMASCFFAYSPKLSPLVEPLRDRFHLLIFYHREEPLLLRKFFHLHPERDEFLKSADELMEELGTQATSMVQNRKKALEDDHLKIRETALSILKKKLSG